MQVIINREELNEALELFLEKKGLAFTNITARVHGAGSGATIDLDSVVETEDEDSNVETEEPTTEADKEPEQDIEEVLAEPYVAPTTSIQGFGQ